ncbi:MAG: hypothetical protein WCB18_04560 [Thermoplasmata archaeon]
MDSHLSATVSIGLLRDSRLVTLGAVDFVYDSGANQTMLGTRAVRKLGLKRRHIRKVGQLGDYKNQSEKVYLLPGIVRLIHQRRTLSRLTDVSEFWLTLAVPPRTLDNAAPTDSIDSLLGQDVMEHMTKTGEKPSRAGSGADVYWEYYEERPGLDESEVFTTGRYRVHVFILGGYVDLVTVKDKRRVT